MVNHETSSNITVVSVLDTIYNADSVEWCPNEPCQHIFVCANYQLDESQSNRFGNIRLLSLDKIQGVILHQVIKTDGILDQKWCHNKINNSSILGVATSENKLEIYRLDEEKTELHLVTSINNNASGTLMLSLDWSTGKYLSETPSVVTSDSKGNISVFDYKNETLEKRLLWNAHEFEAWICAFYYWDTSVIFTGGDDAKLKKFDLRIDTNPVLVKKDHTTGVTAIHSNKEKEHIVATGSYDSTLLLWDLRNMKCPLSSKEMPDSVWRLKWNPSNANFILAACMRGGFHICHLDSSDEFKIVSSYFEHKDIAYGTDWKYSTSCDEQEEESIFVIGACSFYDHKLSVARINLKDCTC